MRDVKSEIHKINQIVTLPEVLAEVMGELVKEDAATHRVTELIEVDPALSANILRAVNSPFYGLRWHIESVATAIGLLGLTETTKLVLAFSLKQQLFAFSWNQQEHLETLWKHSVNTAVLAHLFVKEYDIQTGGKEFTAGLLHDIGKIVILQYFPDQFQMVKNNISSLGQRDIQAETQILETTHCEIGSLLAEKWSLPPDYVEVIKQHHTVGAANIDPKMVSVIRFVDLVTESLGLGIGECSQASLFANDVSFAMLRQHEPRLRKCNLEEVTENLSKQFAEHQHFVGLF